jgi:PAS domain S-box-containing protein
MRRQAEDALRRSEQKYRAIFENVQDVFYQVGLDGRIIDISPSIRRYAGYSREELIGKPILEYYYYPEDRDRLLAAVQATGEALDLEVRLKTRDDRLVYASANAHLLRDDAGTPVGLEGSLRDITERKNMEEQLRMAKLIWEETFDTINDAITIHDREFNIIRMNKSAQRLMDLAPETILAQKCHESYHGMHCPPDCCPAVETLKTGRIAVMERFEPRLNKHIEVRTLPRFDADNRIIGLVHIVVDITERKRTEAANRELQTQLFHSQKMESIGRLAGGVAHDFNNILSAIIGYSEILMRRTAGDRKTQEQLSVIMDSGRKAALLTQQLLALSRKQILAMGIYNLNDIIDGMAKMISRIIGEDIAVELRTGRRTNNIKADKGQIEQVLLNLVVNARDAMPSGGTLLLGTEDTILEEEYTREHVGVEPGTYVALSVSDTGTGMTGEVRERIFEPFFTTKEVGKGTGLGLATVYGIVKQHNGHIFVYSEPGRGTTFKLYFPAALQPVDRSADAPRPDHPRGSETVLVVDDDESIRKLVRDILEPLGYRVLTAAGGAEAMALFVGGPIDLLVTDVIMPGMGGKALADAARAEHPRLKVIFISGYPHDAIAHHGILDPGVVLIQKPLSGSTVAPIVRNVLDGREA